MAGTHPRFALDEAIHTPVRLSIMAALAGADRIDFAFLRDSIEVSDSLLSKHMAHLESAGYVQVIKGYELKRPRTWFSLTEAGRIAFRDYVAVLSQVLDTDHR
ncbi:MAG: winged helix-turn-helix domain-containing protein [Acidimicrobiales bacterium]